MNGVAHVILTVNSIVRSRPLYAALFEEHLGLVRVMDSETFVYWVGKGSAVGISESTNKGGQLLFDQARPGLHHVCFRMRQKEDVDLLVPAVRRAGAKIVRRPNFDDHYAAGYYSILIEDPDGIRLEFNHVPGKGLLSKL